MLVLFYVELLKYYLNENEQVKSFPPFAGVGRDDFLGVLPDRFLGVFLGVRLPLFAGVTEERLVFLFGV
jgi:hypothetical protein